MAKAGHEAEVATVFSKLTEESRKEPGCVMYQVHRHKTEPRRFFIYEQYKDDAALEAIERRRIFCSMRARNFPRLRSAWKGISSSLWDEGGGRFAST